MQTEETLEHAIAYLGAVEVAPGRYAFQIARGDDYPWYVASDAQARIMAERYQALEGGGFFDRVSWVKEQNVRKMPSWWTPERRFAVCIGGCVEHHPYPTLRQASDACYAQSRNRSATCGVVTASLETGDEVRCPRSLPE